MVSFPLTERRGNKAPKATQPVVEVAQDPAMVEIRLTELAHQYNVPAFTKLIGMMERYRSMEVTRSEMSLELSLFVLSNRNGEDVAKRIHMLELAGCTSTFVDRAPEKQGDPIVESDLYIAINGMSFLAGTKGTKLWQETVEFRLGLHRKEHEESKTTRI